MCKKGSCLARCQSKIASSLRLISVGQLKLGLYYHNKLTYSTILGGVVSIIFALILISYSVIVLIPVFDGTGYDTTEASKRVSQDNDVVSSLTIKDFRDYFEFYVVINSTDTDDCQDINAEVAIDYFDHYESVGIYNFTDITMLESIELQGHVYCFFVPFRNTKYQESIHNYSTEEALFIPLKEDNAWIKFRVQYIINDKRQLIQSLVTKYIKFDETNLDQFYDYGKISLDIINNNIFYLKFKLMEYIQYKNSIFGSSSLVNDDYSTHMFINDNDLPLGVNIPNKKNITVMMFFDKSLIQVVRTPYIIWTAISKIGGIFGSLSIITVIISFIHQRMFERSLARDHGGQSKSSNPKMQDERTNLGINQTIISTQGYDDSLLEVQTLDESNETDNLKDKPYKKSVAKQIFSFSHFKRMSTQSDHIDDKLKHIDSTIIEENNKMKQRINELEETIESLKTNFKGQINEMQIQIEKIINNKYQ